MNIVVKPYGRDLCYCRPDTTWEKESRDFYAPEGVERLLWTPVVFARICKAGKCISEKFVTRYYDSFGLGVLIYCNDDELAFSSCADHTSILPMPLYAPVVLDNTENIWRIGDCTRNMEGVRGRLENALCEASRRVSLRIGDLVAVELEPMKILAERTDGGLEFKGDFCETVLFDFKVIF